MQLSTFWPVAQVPPQLLEYLKKLWEQKYPAIYEKGSADFESDFNLLINLFGDKEIVKSKNRLVWLEWALCMACLPTIERYLPLDGRPEKIRKIAEEWVLGKQRTQSSWNGVSFNDIENPNYAQNLGEALLIIKYLGQMYVAESVTEMIEIIKESVDLCLTGYAIAAGSMDCRPILNWLINYAIPCAYNESLPVDIYTINTIPFLNENRG